MAHDKALEIIQVIADQIKRVQQGETVTRADLMRSMLACLPADDPERIRLEKRLDGYVHRAR